MYSRGAVKEERKLTYYVVTHSTEAQTTATDFKEFPNHDDGDNLAKFHLRCEAPGE